MKDAAQDVAEDVTKDVADDVLGAAEYGPSSVSGGNITIAAVACPQLPPSPRPKGFFINGFFIVARSLDVRSPLLVRQAQWQWRSTREGRAHKGRGERNQSGGKRCFSARGDPDVSPPTRLPLGDEGRACEGHGAGRCGGRATGRGAGLGLRGPGGARPHRHATTAAAAAAFVQLALRWGRNWAAQ